MLAQPRTPITRPHLPLSLLAAFSFRNGVKVLLLQGIHEPLDLVY